MIDVFSDPSDRRRADPNTTCHGESFMTRFVCQSIFPMSPARRSCRFEIGRKHLRHRSLARRVAAVAVFARAQFPALSFQTPCRSNRRSATSPGFIRRSDKDVVVPNDGVEQPFPWQGRFPGGRCSSVPTDRIIAIKWCYCRRGVRANQSALPCVAQATSKNGKTPSNIHALPGKVSGIRRVEHDDNTYRRFSD